MSLFSSLEGETALTEPQRGTQKKIILLLPKFYMVKQKTKYELLISSVIFWSKFIVWGLEFKAFRYSTEICSLIFFPFYSVPSWQQPGVKFRLLLSFFHLLENCFVWLLNFVGFVCLLLLCFLFFLSGYLQWVFRYDVHHSNSYGVSWWYTVSPASRSGRQTSKIWSLLTSPLAPATPRDEFLQLWTASSYCAGSIAASVESQMILMTVCPLKSLVCGRLDHFFSLQHKRNAEYEKFLYHCWVDTLNVSFNLLDNDHIYGTACFNFLIITNWDDSLLNTLLHHFTDETCEKESYSEEQADTNERAAKRPQVSQAGYW